MKWLWIALPALLGLALALLLARFAPDVDPIELQISIPALVLIIGTVFSGFAALGYRLAAQSKHRSQKLLQQQHELQESDRRRFMQRLDHEFKNPLTVIRAGIANLSSAISEEERSTALETVNNQTMRLVRLTTDLRKIADLETRPLELADVDLTALLTEVDEVVRENICDGEQQLILSIPRAPWPLPTIVGDWDLLFLAFYNLVDNARKFSQPQDTLEIRAREEDELIIVEVADTGLGIAEEEIPHVWEELYRGENGQAVSGSGLGLPLVKAIIERHNGQINLTSRSGQGSNVTVRFRKDKPTI